MPTIERWSWSKSLYSDLLITKYFHFYGVKVLFFEKKKGFFFYININIYICLYHTVYTIKRMTILSVTTYKRKQCVNRRQFRIFNSWSTTTLLRTTLSDRDTHSKEIRKKSIKFYSKILYNRVIQMYYNVPSCYPVMYVGDTSESFLKRYESYYLIMCDWLLLSSKDSLTSETFMLRS